VSCHYSFRHISKNLTKVKFFFSFSFFSSRFRLATYPSPKSQAFVADPFSAFVFLFRYGFRRLCLHFRVDFGLGFGLCFYFGIGFGVCVCVSAWFWAGFWVLFMFWVCVSGVGFGLSLRFSLGFGLVVLDLLVSI